MSVRVCAACGGVRPSLSEAKVYLCEECEPWDTARVTVCRLVGPLPPGVTCECPQSDTALSSTTHPPREGQIAEGDPREGTPHRSYGTKFSDT